MKFSVMISNHFSSTETAAPPEREKVSEAHTKGDAVCLSLSGANDGSNQLLNISRS